MKMHLKKHIGSFFFLVLFASPLAVYSQVAELGLSGGMALRMGAFGSIYYKASKLSTTPVLSMTFVVNTNRFTESKLTRQVGFSAHAFSRVLGQTDDTYEYFYETIGNDGKDFRYANYILSFTPLMNWKYKLSDVSYVYGGFALGMAGSRNVSNNRGADFLGTDVTYKAPDGGIGFCGGIQAGWVQRLTQRIAFTADLTARYYNLNFTVEDPNYPGGTSFNYGTFMMPITIGLRYRMGWAKELNYATGRMQPVAEEIHKKGERSESTTE